MTALFQLVEDLREVPREILEHQVSSRVATWARLSLDELVPLHDVAYIIALNRNDKLKAPKIYTVTATESIRTQDGGG